MEQKKKGVAEPEICSTFHIVFFNQEFDYADKKICTSVNIIAKNLVDALAKFVDQHPNKVDQIIYVTNLENCKL